MSLTELNRAVERLREAALDAAWRQWYAIFTFVRADRPAQGIVDPEALLVFSMAAADHEPRVWNAACVWATVAPRLLSVQRTKNILKLFPLDLAPRVQEFASTAVLRGGDARWRSLMADEAVETTHHRTESASYRLVSQAAIMLRLRLALGIGIKSDVLSYLIGCIGAGATVQQISDATRYYGRAVRRGVEELAAGGFVQARATSPASYSVDLDAWARLLDFDVDNPPAWRPWVAVYGFVAAVSEWLVKRSPDSELVAASEARDLVAEHRRALDAFGIPDFRPGQHPGAAFLEPFRDILRTCAEYMDSAA